MRFAAPVWLWLLACWPLLAVCYFWAARRRERRMARLVDTPLWPRVAPLHSPRAQRRRLIYRLLALVLLIFALSRPQWGYRWENVKRRALDLIVVLDTSRSMLSDDLRPNRLQQAHWSIRDLVERLEGDRVGLVAFAGDAFQLCPLTLDYGAFLMMLEDARVGIIPRGGTAMTRGLEIARGSFDVGLAADRVILLITDGEDHEGDPLSLIPGFRRDGIRVFAVGIGTPEGTFIPQPDGQGGATRLRDRQNQVVLSQLREEPLQRLARETQGLYVRVAPGLQPMRQIVEEGLATLHRAETEERINRVYEERAGWFIGLAMLLVAVEGLTGSRRSRPLNHEETTS